MLLSVKIVCIIALIFVNIDFGFCYSKEFLQRLQRKDNDPSLTPFRNTTFTDLFYETSRKIMEFSVEDANSNDVTAFLSTLRFIGLGEITLGYDDRGVHSFRYSVIHS